jgi:O-antigen biosynthesis protein
MCAVFRSPFYRSGPELARLISQALKQGELLLVGSAAEESQRQFAEMGSKAVVCASCADLHTRLHQDAMAAPRFAAAFWFYSAQESEDDYVAEELSRCAKEIMLIPGIGASVAGRRPKLVETFQRFGFVPDYECDLTGIDSGALRLVRQELGSSKLSLTGVESALARLHAARERLQRSLRTRMSELEAADRHIARLEEQILKLKKAQREVKRLQQEKQALHKSPERKIGQVLLAPYRLPQKLIRKLRGSTVRAKGTAPPAETLEYQNWLEQQRPTPEQLAAMRKEASNFRNRPLVSVITPVFNTIVTRLGETVGSVLAQAYDNWELIVVDDGSTDVDLPKYLANLPKRDARIRVLRLDRNCGISAATNHGIQQAQGEWIGLLDHDDLLEPDALFEAARLLQEHPDADLIYSDEDKITETGFGRPHFKPDWSPDYFFSQNYFCHFTMFRRSLARKVGGFRSEFDGSQDYDVFMRMIEHTERIYHIPRVLYHWRQTEDSLAQNIRCKQGALEAGRRAVEEHFQRSGERAHVAVDWRTYGYWVRRELIEPKRISIIIPTRDQIELLSRCVQSICAKTSYPNYEIVVIDNDSQSEEARRYFSQFPHRLLHYEGPFNYSAINNFAVEQTESPWLLFLNNDIEATDTEWLNVMAEHIQRPEIGAVGARLLYPDDTVQHGGVVLGAGLGRIAANAFRGFAAEHPGVVKQLQLTRNYSCVTGACLLTRRDVFMEVGGFDEQHLPVTFNDVDFCLKLRRAGYLIVYTPFAKLYHHESATRRRSRLEPLESEIMRKRWGKLLERDPYYNPNLSRERADFSLGK